MIEKITALYARFSRDDKQDNAESVSIANQRQLLQEYADRNGYTNCRFYVDDGYTGTNFDRPDFKRMIEDIRSGLIGTVIFKDMSRLGRNYLMVGQYTEIEFPKYNVRYIAISDNVDSAKGTNDLLPINNLMNEWYSRDISKKIRAQIHHKGRSGQAITSKLPYGYRRNPKDKNEWIVDETASQVVKEIFDMYLNQSLGMKVIARLLNERKIVSPDSHRMLLKGINVDEDKLYCWCGNTVTKILRMNLYLTQPEGLFHWICKSGNITSTEKNDKNYIDSEITKVTSNSIESNIPEDVLSLMYKAQETYAKSSNDGKILEYDYSLQNATSEFNGVYLRNTTLNHPVNISDYIDGKVYARIDKTKPVVLIYHTHTSETYELLDRGYYTNERSTRSDSKDENMIRIGEEI